MDWPTTGIVASIIAALASVVTAVLVVSGNVSNRFIVRRRRIKIETLLAKKTGINDDSLTRAQLAAAVPCTEDQVIEAAARSTKVEPWGGQSGNEYRFRQIKKLK